MSQGEVLQLIVPPSSEETRLDQFLYRQLSNNNQLLPSRSQIQGWIKDGLVTINGKNITKPGAAVKSGDKISYSLPEEKRPIIEAEPMELSVLHDDEDFCVINKPAGLTVHPGAGQREGTLLNGLVHLWGKGSKVEHGERPWLVHRLDKDTSGVLLIAKNDASHRILSRQFHDRRVTKEYATLVYVSPRRSGTALAEDAGTVSTSIGRDPKHRTKMSVVGSGGKSAVTHWRVRERFSYGALLAVSIETGRTHQIRVHLSSIGAPIIGDRTYGNLHGLPEKLFRRSEEFGRQALHAHKLSFWHPRSNELITVEASPPDDFLELVNFWRGIV